MGRPKIVYWSCLAGMQSEGRFYMVGKGSITVVCGYDCNRVPTYHIGSSADSIWCRCNILCPSISPMILYSRKIV